MARCPYKKCINYKDCPIIDITGKVPKSYEKCSYGKEKNNKSIRNEAPRSRRHGK